MEIKILKEYLKRYVCRKSYFFVSKSSLLLFTLKLVVMKKLGNLPKIHKLYEVLHSNKWVAPCIAGGYWCASALIIKTND